MASRDTAINFNINRNVFSVLTVSCAKALMSGHDRTCSIFFVHSVVFSFHRVEIAPSFVILAVVKSFLTVGGLLTRCRDHGFGLHYQEGDRASELVGIVPCQKLVRHLLEAGTLRKDRAAAVLHAWQILKLLWAMLLGFQQAGVFINEHFSGSSCSATVAKDSQRMSPL